MEYTGSYERMETFIYNDTAVEHLHRYAFVKKYINNKKVLDIACGEGYGSNLMAQNAKEVVGVDIDTHVIEKAKEKYSKPNLYFKPGRTDDIPQADKSFDVVVSFETIEHHNKHDEMMLEIRRVLKDDGILIISSPEKSEYSDKINYQNPFHIKELYLEEFRDLLQKYFLNVELNFQRTIKGSAILSEKNMGKVSSYTGDYTSNLEIEFVPRFVIAIASNAQIVSYANFSYFDGNQIWLKEQKKIMETTIINTRNATTKWIKNSWTYKIGSLITRPINFLRGK